MFKKTFCVLVLGCAVLAVSPVTVAQAGGSGQTASSGQSAGVDQTIALLRQDVRSKKKQLIAANLKLTDAQATKFWPVYDRYTADLVKINDKKYALIKEYAESAGKMDDAQALSLTKRALEVDQEVAALRLQYLAQFTAVLPGPQVATFYQIERRVQSLIDLQLSSQLPLVQDVN